MKIEVHVPDNTDSCMTCPLLQQVEVIDVGLSPDKFLCALFRKQVGKWNESHTKPCDECLDSRIL